MPARKTILKVLAILAVAAFVYGVVELFALRFEAGDIYPPYSTLRADPVGAKAYYEALSELPGLRVRRNFLPMRKLEGSVQTTLFLLGCDASVEIADAQSGPMSNHESDAWDDLLNFVSAGGRLVVAFSPTDKPAKDEVLKAKLGLSIKGHDLSGLNTSAGPRASRPGQQPTDAQAVSWHATTYFDDMSPEWNTLYSVDGKPVIVERAMHGGSVVLSADSYYLSNEAMLFERHADLLATLVGPGRVVIFDETHLGVRQEAGVMTLARQYNLTGLGAALLVLAGLFIWRSAASFVPRDEAYAQSLSGASVIGRSSVSGLTHLIRRAVVLRDLVWTCVNEFQRGKVAMPKGAAAKIVEIAAADRAAKKRARNSVDAYRKIVRIVQKSDTV